MVAGGLPHQLVPVFLHEIGFHVPAHIFFTWVVMGFLVWCGFTVQKKLAMVPGGLQNFFEVIIGGLEDFVVSNVGEDGRKVFPILATIFLFIWFNNLVGLIPGCDAATANINTNAAVALIVFVYYNYWGVRNWGLGYIKHFMGPMAALAPMMLILEIMSHLARPLSLTLRLFGNIRGEELVLILLFMLAPLLGTFPLYFLFILADFIQAFVFFMLALVYLKGSFEHAH